MKKRKKPETRRAQFLFEEVPGIPYHEDPVILGYIDEYCTKYGFTYQLINEHLYITTPLGWWHFVLRRGKSTLHHRNKCGRRYKQLEYHVQFYTNETPMAVLQYINYHDRL